MNLCREQNCDRQTNDRQPIVDTPMTTRSNTSLIECHVHLAALPDGDNGGYISPQTLRSRNGFDRQVDMCRGLRLGFRSIGDLISPTSVQAPH